MSLICRVCKGTGLELFRDEDGAERFGAGLCPACDGHPYGLIDDERAEMEGDDG